MKQPIKQSCRFYPRRIYDRWNMLRLGMRGHYTAQAIALAIAASLCAACSVNSANGGPPSAQTAQTPQPKQHPTHRASQVAQALAQAETAYKQGAFDILGQIATSLNARGVKPYETGASDTIAMWHQAAGHTSPPMRGRLLGPAYVRGELEPGEVWRSAQTFKSGETSTLAISHEGAGPVHMKVSDGKAREVCVAHKGDGKPCRFTPLFTQRYDIELMNEGDERAVYFLVFD